ncbi:MAG: hypothetical protein WC595_01075 [Candidatus Nanoarchaeia archaeon]
MATKEYFENNLTQARAKYGENKWWLSKDPAELVRYQVEEPILLTPLEQYQSALTKVLGRDIWDIDMLTSYSRLQQEARSVLELKAKGEERSEKDKMNAAATTFGDFLSKGYVPQSFR